MGHVSYACAQQSHTKLGSLKLLLLFCVRDQAQLDAASVSSIQVVGVVEALIQNADTLFPGGDRPLLVSSLVPSHPQFLVSSPVLDCPHKLSLWFSRSCFFLTGPQVSCL